MLPFPQQPRAAPASAAPNSAQHRDALVEEARKRHYQDLPWGTAALGGGLAGLGIPLALVGLTRPDLFHQPSQLAGLLGATTLAGAGTGVGMEALGRVLTRAAGPSFEPKRWHRDQDPHRWNSAVRTAPLIAALLAGRTIPTVLQEIKQAGAVDQDLRARIAAAEAQVEIPTPDQIESGNYRKGHCTVQGLPITLETAKGQTRSGQDKTGKAWSIQLKNSYGYIKRTSSAEIGDQMDIFLGPFPESQIVFVVDQNKTSGKFDEHKTIVGARTSQEAKDIYHANYSPGWKGFRDCTALTMEQFKAWLKHGDMKVPLAGQQFSTFYKKAGADGLLASIKSKLQATTAAASDASRRYVSNLPGLYGYSPKHVGNAVKYLPHFYSMGVKDQQDDTDPYINENTSKMRRELFRRGLGVHTSSENNFFNDIGAGKLKLAPAALDSNGAVKKDIANNLFGHGPQSPYEQAVFARKVKNRFYSSDPTALAQPKGSYNYPTSSNVLSNYTMKYKGNNIFNVSDKWDVGLNPGEMNLSNIVGDPVTMGARWLLDKTMKPAEFNQDFQQTRAGKFIPMPAPIPQSPVKMHKADLPKLTKSAGWDQTLREIKRQLPGFHVPETVAGGVAGAGVGGVAQLLRRIFQSKQDRKQKGTPSILKGMLYGGGAGALAGNLVGDRARRYISNMPNPFGYDLDNQINDIKENGVQGFVDGFIKDKPIHPPGADGMSTSFSRFVRRELLRRGLNLPTDGVGKDIFDEVGKHTDGSPVLNLAGRFFDASGHLKNTAEALQAWNAIKAVDMPKAQKAVENVFTQNVSPTFGHFATKRMGDTVRFLDRWNFDLHPHEDKKLERYGAKLVDHVSQNLSNPSSWTLANALGDTKAKEFKTLTARWLGDHSFANKMPTFDQTFQVPEDIPSLLQNAPM